MSMRGQTWALSFGVGQPLGNRMSLRVFLNTGYMKVFNLEDLSNLDSICLRVTGQKWFKNGPSGNTNFKEISEFL